MQHSECPGYILCGGYKKGLVIAYRAYIYMPTCIYLKYLLVYPTVHYARMHAHTLLTLGIR
jgi:hypothetical protein